MKVLNLIKELQELYSYYGNVDVVVTELDDVQLICEPNDIKVIKSVDGMPCSEGVIVLKIW